MALGGMRGLNLVDKRMASGGKRRWHLMESEDDTQWKDENTQWKKMALDRKKIRWQLSYMTTSIYNSLLNITWSYIYLHSWMSKPIEYF